MSPAELRKLVDDNTTVPLMTSFEALGLSETAGRKAYARGDLPFRVIRVGNALRVPTCDLAALLLAPDSSEAGAPTAPALALTDEATGGLDANQRLTLHAVQHG